MVARACNALCQEAICARRLFSVVTRRVAQLLHDKHDLVLSDVELAACRTEDVVGRHRNVCVCVCVWYVTLCFPYIDCASAGYHSVLSLATVPSCWQRNKAHRALRSAPVFIAVLWLTKRVQLCFHCWDSQFSNFHHHDNTCKYLHVEYIRINLQRNRLLLGTVKTHGSWYIYLSLYTYSCFCSSLFATYLLNMQLTQYNCNTKKHICGE